MSPVSAMASAKNAFVVGLRALPPLASQNVMPALSGAIPSASLAFPDECLAI